MSLQQIFVLDPKSARSYQMRGIRYEVEVSWREAIQAYEVALKLDPKLRGMHASIGRIYRAELKDEAAAVREYEAELKVNPLSRDANGFFADYYAKQGKPDEARKHTAALEAAPPPSGEAALGVYWLEKGAPETSLPHLLAWRAAEPRSLDVYYYLGEAFTDLKVATIKRLRTANADSYRLHQILAESYASAHQGPKAVEEYRKVLELQPDLPGVRYELGRLLGDTQTQEAIKLLERELELDPNHYLAAAWLGRIYVVQREPDKAVPLLEKALAARPELMDAQKALGQAWAAKREFAKALAYYEIVAQNEPMDGQIHFLLSQVYQALGRKEDAARERALHQQTINRLTAPAEELKQK
jgi:Tfp pilus assembly protein PilF